MREIEKTMKRFDASLEWLMERISLCDEERDKIGRNGEMEADDMAKMVRAKRIESIEEVLEEVSVLIDTHFFNEFEEQSPLTF